jgi:hypothetical protein
MIYEGSKKKGLKQASSAAEIHHCHSAAAALEGRSLSSAAKGDRYFEHGPYILLMVDWPA